MLPSTTVTLSHSTRSSPSPPPTPLARPRGLSTSRATRPARLQQNQSYLASASSSFEPLGDEDVDADTSETEGEILGVRVFVKDRDTLRHKPRTTSIHETRKISPERVVSPASEIHLPRISTFVTSQPARPRPTSPAISRSFPTIWTERRFLFKERICIHLRPTSFDLVFDVRKAGEALLLLGGVLLATWHLGTHSEGDQGLITELLCTCGISLLHPFLGALTRRSPPQHATQPPSAQHRPPENKRQGSAVMPTSPIAGREREMGFLWMTEFKDYRDCPDDGAVTALLFVPLVVSTLLLVTIQSSQLPSSAGRILSNAIPAHWLIDPPIELPVSSSHPHLSALQSLLLSRRNLIQLSTLCSFVMFSHMTASRLKRWWHRGAPLKARTPSPQPLRASRSNISAMTLEEDRSKEQTDTAWIPKGELRRTWQYTKFSLSMVAVSIFIKLFFNGAGFMIWEELSYFEMATIVVSYQFIIYVMVRLARRGFTLGELGLVAQGATALFMESVNLTGARMFALSTPYIKTYRSPTPLLIFQIALIPGAFLTGFLLSPLLVLSRNISQKPSHRLRHGPLKQSVNHPIERIQHRKMLAFGFYGGAAIIVGGLIGIWTQWCLEGQNPWVWVGWWTLGGNQRTWRRVALLAYWGALGSLSVAGWNRQLVRARRLKWRGGAAISGPSGSGGLVNAPLMQEGHPPEGCSSNLGSAALKAPAATSTASHSMTDLLDAADKHVPVLGLNARRKFFHALAVGMFVPGIALDPAFSHLAFSVAFSLFIFVEYIRYFALYPFGAAVHLFLNEFLDHKDSGTAILSHFYLLTGCAGTLWLEGPWKVLELSGVLILGVGDAVASIVGKRWGRHPWTSDSPKTVEGSAAFTASIVVCAWILRLFGLMESFSTPKYVLAVALSSALEALSLQNDNLTLPLYLWTMLILLRAIE